MVPANIQDALLDELKEMSPENATRLHEMARSLRRKPSSKEHTLEEVLRNLLVWDEERAREMDVIIEAGCEQIDHSDMKPTRLRGSRIEDIMRNIELMDPERARELEQIIEEGCEQIDPTEW